MLYVHKKCKQFPRKSLALLEKCFTIINNNAWYFRKNTKHY